MKHNLPTTLFYYNEEADTNPYAHQGKPYRATVNDITGDETKYSLDDHGFTLVNHETNVQNFLDPENVKQNYYPELEELMKAV
jgi:hypothetical protein